VGWTTWVCRVSWKLTTNDKVACKPIQQGKQMSFGCPSWVQRDDQLHNPTIFLSINAANMQRKQLCGASGDTTKCDSDPCNQVLKKSRLVGIFPLNKKESGEQDKSLESSKTAFQESEQFGTNGVGERKLFLPNVNPNLGCICFFACLHSVG